MQTIVQTSQALQHTNCRPSRRAIVSSGRGYLTLHLAYTDQDRHCVTTLADHRRHRSVSHLISSLYASYIK